jgi:2-polyprenyl-3-methyl-5-hydroxy-6-metoxy-1,4-benzoquinol methylase
MEPQESRLQGEISQQLFDGYRSTGMGSSGAGHETPPELARYIKAVILPLLPRSTDAQIADLACGGGDLLAILKAVGYTRLAGVDISMEQTERCHARGLSFVIKGDARDFLVNRVGEFDCLVAMDLFEHLELTQAIELARAVARSLRPGGQLVIQTCNAISPFFGSVRYADLTHVTAYTPQSLRQLLRAAGFRSVDVHPVAPVGRSARGLVRRAAWELISRLVRLYLLAETGQRGHIVSRNVIAVATI